MRVCMGKEHFLHSSFLHPKEKLMVFYFFYSHYFFSTDFIYFVFFFLLTTITASSSSSISLPFFFSSFIFYFLISLWGMKVFEPEQFFWFFHRNLKTIHPNEILTIFHTEIIFSRNIAYFWCSQKNAMIWLANRNGFIQVRETYEVPQNT